LLKRPEKALKAAKPGQKHLENLDLTPRDFMMWSSRAVGCGMGGICRCSLNDYLEKERIKEENLRNSQQATKETINTSNKKFRI